MQRSIHRGLAPVRSRQILLAVLNGTSWGLLGSGLGGLALGAWRVFSATPITVPVALTILCGGPAIGIAYALMQSGCTLRSAARAVDDRYRLKDRMLTALSFADLKTREPLHEMQLRDAENRLARVAPQEVVPYRVPRWLAIAAGTQVAEIALLVWPLASTEVEARLTEPLPEIVAEATTISEELEKLEEMAKEQQDPELADLVGELKELAEAMKEPNVDLKEALAKISEMQAALMAQQAQYNVASVDAQLEALGEAMTGVAGLQSAASALENGKHEEAAKALEEVKPEDLDEREAKAAGERMRKVAKAMKDAGLGELSEASQQMAEGLCEGSESQCKVGASKLAGQCRSQGKKKACSMCLGSQLACLSECKSNCQKNSLARGKTGKSKSSSTSFGMGTDGDLTGEQTKLDGKRNLEKITGTQGEGDSEIETTHSPEGKQAAAREYREVYDKYQKMSEAVLESEPLPLAHRQTIRKYFELIRPQNSEIDATEPAKASE